MIITLNMPEPSYQNKYPAGNSCESKSMLGSIVTSLLLDCTSILNITLTFYRKKGLEIVYLISFASPFPLLHIYCFFFSKFCKHKNYAVLSNYNDLNRIDNFL